MATTGEPPGTVEVEGHQEPMENGRGSWWFKLDRAQKHLEEIHDYGVRYSERRPYTARREVKGYGDHEFVVRAFLHDPPDYTLATIYGDFFFNVRSALDHLAVALVPNEHRRTAAFPIYTDDPRRMRKGDKRRRSFERSTKGMTAAALKAILDLQPFNQRLQHPELHQLAVLDDFAQADKHRELVAFAQYIRDPQTFLVSTSGEVLYSQVRPQALLMSGGIVARFPLSEPLDETEVDVQVNGSIEIGLKRIDARGDFDLPGTLAALLGHVRDIVIPPLEALL